MKLTQTGSLWGNLYRLRHYLNGTRISDTRFKKIYSDLGLTPDDGIMTKSTSSKFRKDWIIPDARTNRCQHRQG